jgi:hypothetical protein
MSQFPSHAMRGRHRIADLDPASSTVGIEAAEPEVMLARSIYLPLKPAAKSSTFRPMD